MARAYMVQNQGPRHLPNPRHGGQAGGFPSRPHLRLETSAILVSGMYVVAARGTNVGGSNTRPRAGTEDERRAIAALRGRGRGNYSGSKGRGKSSTYSV